MRVKVRYLEDGKVPTTALSNEHEVVYLKTRDNTAGDWYAVIGSSKSDVRGVHFKTAFPDVPHEYLPNLWIISIEYIHEDVPVEKLK